MAQSWYVRPAGAGGKSKAATTTTLRARFQNSRIEGGFPVAARSAVPTVESRMAARSRLVLSSRARVESMTPRRATPSARAVQ